MVDGSDGVGNNNERGKEGRILRDLEVGWSDGLIPFWLPGRRRGEQWNGKCFQEISMQASE